MRDLTYFILLIVVYLGMAKGDQVTEVTRNNSNNITSITNRSQLYRSNSEIDVFQQSFDLIRVNATPTHAALHPGWPESLVSLALTGYSFLTAQKSSESYMLNVITKIVIPFALSVTWTTGFGIMQHNTTTSGWISVTFYPIMDVMDDEYGILYASSSELLNIVLGLMTAVSAFLNLVQLFGSAAIVGQRWAWIGFGSVAYNISDANGCIPYENDFKYLERGYRSHIFRILQTAQYGWAILAVIAGSCAGDTITQHCKKGRVFSSTTTTTDWGKWKWWYYGFTIIMIVPSLIYEVVVATQGVPVKVSGNCLLVEADPKFGFLDTQIDNGWKALVSITGL